jgi:hypothetical protein
VKALGRLARSRALKLTLAGLLLIGLYMAADWRAVAGVLAALDPLYLAAALGLFVPQTVVSAMRWQALAAGVARISLAEAVRHTLASSALNLVAPSKLGDLSKAAMLPGLTAAGRARAVVQVAVEKGADVVALGGLLLWGTVGWRATGLAVIWLTLAVGGVAAGWCPRATLRFMVRPALGVANASILLWLLHLAQIDLFLKAAGVFVPWEVMLARVPVAIFAGLLPISLWGLGTRDAALVLLFSDVAPSATMAAVGLLTALRYLVPGAVGIPLLTGVWSGQSTTHKVLLRP